MQTIKVQVYELVNDALDWAVGTAEGGDPAAPLTDDERYSTEWALGGPIIERELINLDHESVDLGGPDQASTLTWRARKFAASGEPIEHFDLTMLIAAMRCYVVSKLGDEVEVPAQYVK